MTLENEMTKSELSPFAAAVYTPDAAERDALVRFVAELSAGGIRVGGLLQEARHGPAGEKAGIDLVEITSGERFPINRPTKENLASGTCSLDTSVLADSSAAMRRAIAARVDLIVLEKFGDQEQKGQGLSEEIFTAIAEEIPLLIAVPEDALELWRERSGGLGETLDFTLENFRRWWQGVKS
mgnify:FL=1